MTMSLTEGKPLSVIFRFSLPILGGSLFQLFYTLADSIIVGQTIGEEALAAVGSTTIVVYFILCFIQGFTNGFSILLAKSIGSGSEERAKKNIASSIYISVFYTLIITVITCPLCPLIIKAISVPEQISKDSATYLFVILLGTGATIFYNLISNILRALGDSKTPLVYLVFSSLLNIVLDIVFIVPFGWGVMGAALATVLSQLLSAILSFYSAIKKYPLMRLKKNDWEIDRNILFANFSLGFIMGFQMSVMCIGQLVMQASVNKLGTEAIAGYTAATKVDQLSVLVNNAFLTAIAAYMAQNYGAGREDRISSGVKASIFIVEMTNLAMMLTILLLEPYVVPLFVSDASSEVFNYAKLFFYFTIPFYPLLGLLIVFRTTVQAVGNTKVPFIACIVELFARSFASVILGSVIGYIGIVLSSPLAWLGADLIVICSYFNRRKKLGNNAN